MERNIGWLYYKSYFEKLEGNTNNGMMLKKQNQELKEIEFDSLAGKQLADERKTLCSMPLSSYYQFSLSTYYPGLITGIGMNHQTTLEWKDGTQKIPELKLGMAFDHATGLPIIPGASLKGLLRNSFPISNQQGFCDSYEEKVEYIASIIQRIVNLEEGSANSKSIIHSAFQKKLWEDYKKQKEIPIDFSKEYYSKQSNNSIIEQKEALLWELFDNDEITEDQYEEQIASLPITIVEEEISQFYESNREKRKKKEELLKKSTKEFNEKIYNLFLETPASVFEGWLEKAPLIAQEIFEGISDGKALPIYKRDTFFDAFPIANTTPTKLFETDNITPHQSPFQDPKPISFLKIRPKVSFSFFFNLHDGILTSKQKILLFYKILCDKGAGAKTNVGYGQFADNSKKTDFFTLLGV